MTAIVSPASPVCVMQSFGAPISGIQWLLIALSRYDIDAYAEFLSKTRSEQSQIM